MALPSVSEIGGAITVGIATIGAAFALWKKQSSTSLEVKENSSKGGWITELQKRAEQAEARERLAFEQHNADIKTIAGLEWRLATMTEKIERMSRHLAMVTDLLVEQMPGNQLVQIIAHSNFGMMDMHNMPFATQQPNPSTPELGGGVPSAPTPPDISLADDEKD